MNPFTRYLQLGDRLSQVWVNKYTLLILIGLFKLHFFSNSINRELNIAKDFILSKCNTIDSLYNNVTTNTPHYLGLLGNYLISKTAEETIEATLGMLSLLVYASEELLTFVIDLYLGTYACLIVSAIDGTVDVATNATEKIIGAANDTISTFANELDDGLDDISNVINKILSAVSKVEDFFTDNDDDDNDGTNATNNIKKVNLTIAALRNVYIPSSINDKLEELSAKTPDFATVKNMTKTLISEPFELVRKEIKSIDSTNILKNSTSLLYVPPINENISDSNGICSKNKPEIETLFKDIGKSLKYITTIFTILLIVCSVIWMLIEGWKEYKQWKRLTLMRSLYLKRHNDWLSTTTSDDEDDITIQNFQYDKSGLEKYHFNGRDETFDIIESYQICFNKFQMKLSGIFVQLLTFKGNFSNYQKSKIEWFVAYITSERVLFVLGLGLLGIVICGIQLIILSFIKKSIHETSTITSNLAQTKFATTLKKDMELWSNQTNLYINQTETNMNTQIFGWVEKTTTSVNNTVNTMITDIDDTLADIFNGTLLYNPMRTVVKCVIEDKLYTVEKAMTWIHNKAHISLPQINSTELQLSLDNQTNSTTVDSTSVIESLVKEIEPLLEKVLRGFHTNVIYELIIASSIVGLWFLQIPIALILLYWKSYHQHHHG